MQKAFQRVPNHTFHTRRAWKTFVNLPDSPEESEKDVNWYNALSVKAQRRLKMLAKYWVAAGYSLDWVSSPLLAFSDLTDSELAALFWTLAGRKLKIPRDLLSVPQHPKVLLKPYSHPRLTLRRLCQ